MEQKQTYCVRLKEQLDANWSDWLGKMAVSYDQNKGETVLTGIVRDQADLYGLLVKIHSLGLTLLAVNQIDDNF